MPEKIFNIRAYGLLINRKDEILVVQETIKKRIVTKFPGGGLEFGEGLVDCLIREFREELGITIEIKSHFYTTDFFVESFFNPQHQIISVYYLVQTNLSLDNKYSNELKDELMNDELFFSWLPVADLVPELFTLPIDKHVCELLRTALLEKNKNR